ncbi:MAG TPA: D-alanyl-D-alanine carboxypeptidase/D-alanyl-D-alanine-endopeptidase [Thermoanaerobaculia bacterium]|nr:D-alanyl-D-alanine carboxypeptidase/D-alanyl-D-alanine-endopeptidase [Thermoanaerobaculia bacterium]
MRRAALLLATLALLALPAAAQAAAKGCQEMRQRLVRGGGGASGLLVVDAASGRRLCGRAAKRPRTLASNMKLFTTAAALGRFGPNYRIPTQLLSDGTLDRRGVLRGDLYLVGGGDPALGSPAFYERFLGLGTNLFGLKRQLRGAGLRSVTGRLFADDTVFDRRRGVADSGYATSPYIGPLSGLAFNSGYSSSSGGGFASDPATLATRKLSGSLRKAGIRIRGGTTRRPAPATAEQLAVVRSPTMRQLAEATNVPSNNFFAETLIKLLGARYGGAGSTAAGARVVERFARSRGSGLSATDGSGLTRTNRASPAQVVRLLTAMQNNARLADPYVQSLALSARTGTVDDRMQGSAAAGRCRVKTGTLSGVSSLSGLCFNRSGRTIAFSVLMNGVYSLTRAHREQDRIAAMVARY